jgi:hypothetical protein
VKGKNSNEYGVATALKIPLDGYFDDRPYQKGTIWDETAWDWRLPDMTTPGSQDLRLMPLAEGEDPEDSGVYIDGYTNESIGRLLGNRPNGKWDGDKRLSDPLDWNILGYLNPFDIDNNGVVELPAANDPNKDNFSNQHDNDGMPYTKARVLQHTLTHEIIHVLTGPRHSMDSRCVMFKYSTNWKRDHYLCDQWRTMLNIHNK